MELNARSLPEHCLGTKVMICSSSVVEYISESFARSLERESLDQAELLSQKRADGLFFMLDMPFFTYFNLGFSPVKL
jgi:hypothetical protein